jgi:hypothetical protein
LLLLLALIVAAFAATWITLPTSSGATVSAPASWFASGLTNAEHVPACHHPKNGCFSDGTLYTPTLARRRGLSVSVRGCGIYSQPFSNAPSCAHPAYAIYSVDTASLKRRVETIYGAAVLIVLLIAGAFFVGSRRLG